MPVALLLGYVALIVALIGSWIANVVKLVAFLSAHGFDAITAKIALRIVGVPVGPIGVIMGWF